MHKRTLVVGISLVVVLTILMMSLASSGWAAPLPQIRSVITYPESGATVGGVVEVRGIATHPTMDFYQLRYTAGPQETASSQWVDFAIVRGKQVENDVLATWDTTSLPDGQYTLALAVWGVNDPSNPWLFFARNVTVNNAQPPAPTPTQEQETTPEPPPTAVVGPTPTPVPIEQPATSTPRPTATVEAGEGSVVVPTASTGDGDGFAVALDTPGLRSAFCTGGLITLMLFLLWGLYLLAKVSIRWYMRQHVGPPLPRE